MHDFVEKLKQEKAIPSVRKYISSWSESTSEDVSLRNLFSFPMEKFSSPLSINLDLTVACNYRCPHCIDEDIINTKFRLSEDVITKSLINLKMGGLKTVILIGGGEPTIHPKFTSIVKTIKALELGCAIVTNGSRTDRILQASSYFTDKDWIRLSLDAGSDAVFQHLHAPRTSITLDEICKGAAAIKVANPAIELGFSFIVISPEAVKLDGRLIANHREIQQAAQLAKENKFDYISFKPYLFRDEEGKETIPYVESLHQSSSYQEIKDQLALAAGHNDNTFKVVESINLLNVRSAHIDKSILEQPAHCHMQKFRQVLTPMGIFACPAYRGNQKSKVAESGGYATVAQFMETCRNTYKQIRAFDASVECRNISCIYNSTNRWLEDMVKQEGMPAGVEMHSETSFDLFL